MLPLNDIEVLYWLRMHVPDLDPAIGIIPPQHPDKRELFRLTLDNQETGFCFNIMEDCIAFDRIKPQQACYEQTDVSSFLEMLNKHIGSFKKFQQFDVAAFIERVSQQIGRPLEDIMDVPKILERPFFKQFLCTIDGYFAHFYICTDEFNELDGVEYWMSLSVSRNHGYDPFGRYTVSPVWENDLEIFANQLRDILECRHKRRQNVAT